MVWIPCCGNILVFLKFCQFALSCFLSNFIIRRSQWRWICYLGIIFQEKWSKILHKDEPNKIAFERKEAQVVGYTIHVPHTKNFLTKASKRIQISFSHVDYHLKFCLEYYFQDYNNRSDQRQTTLRKENVTERAFANIKSHTSLQKNKTDKLILYKPQEYCMCVSLL